jgi:hypothetical protein
MSRDLDRDLAAALQVLAELGPLQVLEVHLTPPGRRPAPPAAAAASPQPSLFEPGLQPTPPDADALSPLPPGWRWRAFLRNAGAPRSPTPPTWRSHP